MYEMRKAAYSINSCIADLLFTKGNKVRYWSLSNFDTFRDINAQWFGYAFADILNLGSRYVRETIW